LLLRSRFRLSFSRLQGFTAYGRSNPAGDKGRRKGDTVAGQSGSDRNARVTNHANAAPLHAGFPEMRARRELRL